MGRRVQSAVVALGERAKGRGDASQRAACRRDICGNAGAGQEEDAPRLPLDVLPDVFDDLKAVVYNFAPSRAGEHTRAFLQHDEQPWRGKLVCDGSMSTRPASRRA